MLDHYMMTPENPRHRNCPKWERRWYTFQRYIVTEKRMYKPIKWPLSQAIIDVICPLFNRLASEGLFDSCKQGCTQNRSESFNSLIWSLSLKKKYNCNTRCFSAHQRGVVFNFTMKCSVWNITLWFVWGLSASSQNVRKQLEERPF